MRSTPAAAVLVLVTAATGFAQTSASPADANASHMSVYTCLTLIAVAGIVGGLINTLMTDGKFRLPRLEAGIWCPGFIGNALIGGFASVISWALYGAGAGIDLARQSGERQAVSLSVGALAGAALVGFAGAKWLTSEVDTKLLRASVNVASEGLLPPEQRAKIASAPAVDVLKTVQEMVPGK